MPKRSSARTGSELFVVDNSEEDWKALRYLKDWCEISRSIDIASGYFEVGALLALDGDWQKLDNMRILMGDEVSLRTKRTFETAFALVAGKLDDSIESEKQRNHFLSGAAAIVDALKGGKIECRVYRKDKFHAKTYITHARLDVVGSSALVGSSNFTVPGLTQNIELNVQITGTPVAVLQEWYEEHWEAAEDVTPSVLRTFERHIRQYLPFEVYARSLQQYFLGHEETASEWEKSGSRIFPVLARYQQDGYGGLLKRAEKYGGAFLCDGVGLGKTFIGLMLIERFAVHEKKNVALFVPKSTKKPVWERELRKRLPDVFKGYSRLKIFSHTDLMRKSEQEELDRVAEEADVILIDEAHHFRNTGTKGEEGEGRKSRYWRLFDLAQGKQMFLLTATPINNRLTDFQHMVELFTQHQVDHFAGGTLGIHSLPGYIRQLEKKIEAEIYGIVADQGELELNSADVSLHLSADPLFNALVVQRSRSYVKESMKRDGDGEVMFPEPRKPTVAEYSVRQTYGKLLEMVAEAFNKSDPLFVLGIYNPYAYYKGDSEDVATALERGRLKQVVALIRTSFLKRFESSAEAFRKSCWRLLIKLLAWMEVHCETEHEKASLSRWKRKHAKLLNYKSQQDMFDEVDEAEEDLVPPELLEAVEKLPRKDFKLDEIIADTLADLEQVADFLYELEKFKPSQDLKLKKLIEMLTKDPVLSKHKVLIFTEFADTARYVAQQLKEAGVDGVDQIDSGTKGDRAKLIQRFAPYYNESCSAEQGDKEIRVFVSTDVLSEGLNLQDATRLINYDLHWNPVRLMQRIGRVDRRMNAAIEAQIVADHPDQKALRGTVAYWNFLPPDDLDVLLKLYGKVAHKTLRISKTLGIEGRQLLREDDDYEDLRNFSEQYEGQQSPDEAMHLEWQDLLNATPGLDEQVSAYPSGIFSGKQNLKPGTAQVFFCYARPAHDKAASDASGEDVWTAEAGDVQWYLYDVASGEIREDAPMIVGSIRSTPETPRVTQMGEAKLSDIRNTVEKHIAKSFLRKVQAPLGVKPVLKAWMELN